MPDLTEHVMTILKDRFTPWMIGFCEGAELPVDPEYLVELVDEQCTEWATAIATEIRSQIPSVAFKAEGRSDVDAFREAAAKLDAGFQPGGGNMTYAVSRLLREAATVLEGCTPDELATRAQRGWAPAQGANRG
jgi:hypothetical protein